MNTSVTSLKKGQFIIYNREIWQVISTTHNFRGRGSATVKIRMKNLKSENSLDISYQSGEFVETPDVDSVKLQFLYKEGDLYHFMDPKTYDQHDFSKSQVSEIADFLKEGGEYFALMHNGKSLTIRNPKSLVLVVTEADEAIKGNTAEAAKKFVRVETGVKIAVPLFIKKGDKIVIKPETGEYIERET